jgi:hypothetical protein
MFPKIFNTPDINVFEALKRNDQLKKLTSLSLFGFRGRQWSQRSPLLPSCEYTLELVTHFQHLQHLELRSCMVSQELMMELAESSREKLQTLTILLTFSAHFPTTKVPEISSSAWSALVARSPTVKIDCVIMSRMPDLELNLFLKPEMPLNALTVLKYGRCSRDLIYSLSQKFKATLRSFICYNDPSDCGSDLVRLATECRFLDTLFFHGHIHINTLTQVVKLRPNWKRLEFVEKLIDTDQEEEEEFDDDVVIGRRLDGDLVQVGLVRFHGDQSQEKREQQMKELCAEVSQRLGYAWKPLDSTQLPS